MWFIARFWWLFVVLGLAGCDSSSPAFQGLPTRQVTIDGSVFSIRANKREAEAIRINREWRARGPVIVEKGARAIEIATGCEVKRRSLKGDTNIVRSRLACPAALQHAAPRAPDLNLDCGLVAPLRKSGFGTRSAEVDCTVIGRSP